MITISAFKWVPPFAQGLVRDLRVRWALEEAGLPYEARLIDSEIQASADYRELQPFGQVPVFEEGGLALFESGAIVLHIASRSEVLLPTDLLDTEPTLKAYKERCEARPAFQKALESQMKAFESRGA